VVDGDVRESLAYLPNFSTPRITELSACQPVLRGAGRSCPASELEASVNGIIYIVGLIVVVLFILSFLGLR
jgi:hypothetical protein